NSMEGERRSWKLLKALGSFWKPLEALGSPWKFMEDLEASCRRL
ncbi:hypothetical protein Tco_0689019, partial [Tanacetum coccineum]